MKRLALIVDVRNWAFHNIAGHIEQHLSSDMEIKIFFTEDYEDETFGLLEDVYLKFKAEHVHFFWREQYFSLWRNPVKIVRQMAESGVEIDTFCEAFDKAVNTSTVYDHMHGDEEALRERDPLFEMLDGYSVASPILNEIYTEAMSRPPVTITEDGIDLSQFYPLNRLRFLDVDRPLVVGWTGNSEWGSNHFKDMKGLHTIINPAIAQLQSEQVPVVGVFADRKDKWRSRDEMRDYYSTIDVLVCASEFEGTPNPVLEAMACGVPVITTRVGIVEMAMQGPQAAFVLPERSVEEMIKALRVMAEDRKLLEDLAEFNLRTATQWSWESKMPKWKTLFHHAAENHAKSGSARSWALHRILANTQELDTLRKGSRERNCRLNEMRETLSAKNYELQKVRRDLEKERAAMGTAEKRIDNLLNALNDNRNARINYQNQLQKLTGTGN